MFTETNWNLPPSQSKKTPTCRIPTLTGRGEEFGGQEVWWPLEPRAAMLVSEGWALHYVIEGSVVRLSLIKLGAASESLEAVKVRILDFQEALLPGLEFYHGAGGGIYAFGMTKSGKSLVRLYFSSLNAIFSSNQPKEWFQVLDVSSVGLLDELCGRVPIFIKVVEINSVVVSCSDGSLFQLGFSPNGIKHVVLRWRDGRNFIQQTASKVKQLVQQLPVLSRSMSSHTFESGVYYSPEQIVSLDYYGFVFKEDSYLFGLTANGKLSIWSLKWNSCLITLTLNCSVRPFPTTPQTWLKVLPWTNEIVYALVYVDQDPEGEPCFVLVAVELDYNRSFVNATLAYDRSCSARNGFFLHPPQLLPLPSLESATDEPEDEKLSCMAVSRVEPSKVLLWTVWSREGESSRISYTWFHLPDQPLQELLAFETPFICADVGEKWFHVAAKIQKSLQQEMEDIGQLLEEEGADIASTFISYIYANYSPRELSQACDLLKRGQSESSLQQRIAECVQVPLSLSESHDLSSGVATTYRTQLHLAWLRFLATAWQVRSSEQRRCEILALSPQHSSSMVTICSGQIGLIRQVSFLELLLGIQAGFFSFPLDASEQLCVMHRLFQCSWLLKLNISKVLYKRLKVVLVRYLKQPSPCLWSEFAESCFEDGVDINAEEMAFFAHQIKGVLKSVDQAQFDAFLQACVFADEQLSLLPLNGSNQEKDTKCLFNFLVMKVSNEQIDLRYETLLGLGLSILFLSAYSSKHGIFNDRTLDGLFNRTSLIIPLAGRLKSLVRLTIQNQSSSFSLDEFQGLSLKEENLVDLTFNAAQSTINWSETVLVSSEQLLQHFLPKPGNMFYTQLSEDELEVTRSLVMKRAITSHDFLTWLPSVPAVLYLRGQSWLQQGEADRALDCFKGLVPAAIRTTPHVNLLKRWWGEENGWIHAAELLEQYDSHEQALELYRLAISAATTEKDQDVLRVCAFRCALALSEDEKAYCLIHSITDIEKQQMCIGHLVAKLCEEHRVNLLYGLAFGPLQDYMEQVLWFRAKQHFSASQGAADYYAVLYGYYVHRCDFKNAARAMWISSLRLQQKQAGNFIEMAETQLNSVTAAIQALRLTDPPWLVIDRLSLAAEPSPLKKRFKMTIEDEMEEDCKEEGIDAVEYVTLSQMQQRYSLLKAKLMLAKKFPFLQRSMFVDEPEAVISHLVEHGQYEQAIELSISFGVSLLPVLSHLAGRCTMLSRSATTPWEMAMEEEMEGGEERVLDYDLNDDLNLPLHERAWDRLQRYLESFNQEEYDLGCLARVLESSKWSTTSYQLGATPPFWLHQRGMKANAPQCLREYLRHGLTKDATNSLVDFIRSESANNYRGIAPHVHWLPYSLIDAVLCGAETEGVGFRTLKKALDDTNSLPPPPSSSPSSSSLQEQHQQELKEELNGYLKRCVCVREDCQENPRDQDSFQQMGNIKDLPDDVLGLILSRLFVPDLLTALRVNRWFHEVMETTWFWKSTYLQRFGANPSPTIALGGEGGEGFKKACLDKTVAKKSAALECHIIWADVGYYWKMVKDVASEYGRVAELGNVCWFEVNANFERIPRGVYRITWRVRFKDALLHLFSDLKMVARAVPQEAEEAESGEGWTIQDAFDYHKYRKKNRREKVWTELSHPSLLVVKFPLARVQVRLFDHSNSWKSGIKLDWCKLSYE